MFRIRNLIFAATIQVLVFTKNASAEPAVSEVPVKVEADANISNHNSSPSKLKSTRKNETESKRVPLFQQRQDPCYDRTHQCGQWASASECRKKNAHQYMKQNCPYSCNLCNPSLETWTPRPSHYLCRRTFASQEDLDVTLFTGVPQKIDFSDSPILQYSIKTNNRHTHQGVVSKPEHEHVHPAYSNENENPNMNPMGTPQPQQQNEAVYIANRIHDVLASQANYLDDFYADLEYYSDDENEDEGEDEDEKDREVDDLEDGRDGRIQSPGHSSINTDYEHIPDGTLLPLAELCINRHAYCANWAFRGFCELKPTSMQLSCAPACGYCKMNVIHGNSISVYETDDNLPSAFRRNDLFGIMDSIQEERVIVDWYTVPYGMQATNKANIKLVQREIDGEPKTRLYTEKMKKSMYVMNRGPAHVEFLKDTMGTNETGIFQQQVLYIDNFTSPEACQAVLDAIKFGVGLDNVSARNKRGDDGFTPKATKEVRINYSKPGSHDFNDFEGVTTSRFSSILSLYPTLEQSKPQTKTPAGGEGESKYDSGSGSGRMLFAPSIERLLLKLSLLMGIPVEHVEYPIKVEKFQSGEFRSEVSHFRDAIQTMESDRYFESPVLKSGGEYFLDERLKGAEAATMQNARIFGVTIFLSDVEEGGSLFFPRMGGVKVDPKIGRAVVFPTVVSLNGNWNYDRNAPDDLDDLDEVYGHEDSDDSFLLEDLTTIFGHEKVVTGTKYSITIYFRRYADQDIEDVDIDEDDIDDDDDNKQKHQHQHESYSN